MAIGAAFGDKKKLAGSALRGGGGNVVHKSSSRASVTKESKQW